MYVISEAQGSLASVLDHKRRCGRAPALYKRCQRGDVSRSRAALYVRMAIAMPSWFRKLSGTWLMTAASHLLMNTEATELVFGLSPASNRRSMPLRNAPAAARYC